LEYFQKHPLAPHFRSDRLVAEALALYIHIPFCRQKCGYCDFYSTTELHRLQPFVDSLIKEIEFYSQNPPYGGFSVSTIYFGGGTPSLLSVQQVETILNRIQAGFNVAAEAEITLEANPGTLQRDQLADLRRLGVNRISLGIQSFHDHELQQLSRIHNASAAKRSILQARDAGFDQLSLDLIYALPQQSPSAWCDSLGQAIAFAPEHLSCYSLTIEPSTPLGRQVELGQVQPNDEETERELFLLTDETLKKAGYEHYEISNYCRPGFRSRHNQKYWQGTPYLGLGPSAHSFDGHKRWWNLRDVALYTQALVHGRSAVQGSEELTPEQKQTETILLGLRTKEGFQPAAVWPAIEPAVAAMGGTDIGVEPFSHSPSGRLLTWQQDRLALTVQGLLLYNYVCEKLCSQIT
jgi:oxygen-independent coproporphyrinogen III oxidase